MKKIYYCFLLMMLPMASFADGNNELNNSYSHTSCGLNYVTASQRLGQRPNFNPPGVAQPAPFVISGIPSCANIEKAFLYVDGSADGTAQTATITGPAGTFNIPVPSIGNAPDKCWGYVGSYSYRADVTAAVSGNGTYNISGLLTSPPASGNDMDGATLIVIYSDPSQTWQGTIFLDDGALERSGPGAANHTITFPAPCGPTSNARTFVIIADLQNNGTTITANGQNVPYTFDWWNYLDIATTLTAGQTTCDFTFNSGGDCYNVVLNGLYYQTTTCVVCTPPATVTLSIDSTNTTCDFCNGAATVNVVTGTGPFTYSWAPGGQNTQSVTGLCPGTYTVTVTAQCGAGSKVVNIEKGAGGFTLDNTQVDPECFGYCDGTATIIPTGGTAPFTYLWIPTGGNGATASNLCAGTYTINVTDANNCVNKDTITLTEPAQEPSPIPDNASFCQFSPSSVLTATPTTPGATIKWYDVPTGGTALPGAPLPSTDVAGTFTWYISEVNNIGCESPRVPITAYVKTKPLPPIVTQYTYCQYLSLAVPLAGIGDSLQWYQVNAGGLGTYTAPIPDISLPSTFLWYVSQTVEGCESDRSTQKVTVNPGVIAGFTYELVTGCASDTILLKDSSTVNGTEYVHWEFGDGTPPENFDHNPVHVYYGTGVYPVVFVVSNGFCSDTATKDVTVVVTPVLPLAVSAGTIKCPGDTAQLHAYGGDPTYIYSWSPMMWIEGANTADPVVAPQVNTVYTASALDTFGCIHTGSIRVTLASNAVISLPDSVTIYPGETYQLNPGGNCSYFTWFPPNGLSAANISNPIANPEVSTHYYVYGSTESGCKTMDSIDIFVDPSSLVNIPNAFSPANGTFKVEKRGVVSLKSFKIFDRWGVTVFESTDINKGWDGNYKGAPQPMGVYVFIVEAYTSEGKKFYKQGNVTLLR